MSLLLSLVLAFLVADDKKPHPMIGNWLFKSLQTKDTDAKGDDAERFRLTVTASKIYLHFNDKKNVAEWKVKLDDSVTPHLIDLVQIENGEESTRREGIYKVVGDTFTLCLGNTDNERPTAFEIKPDTNWILVIMKRDE